MAAYGQEIIVIKEELEDEGVIYKSDTTTAPQFIARPAPPNLTEDRRKYTVKTSHTDEDCRKSLCSRTRADTEGKHHTCRESGKSFQSNRAMETGENGEKPHICKDSGKSFSLFATHKKPYVQHVCPKCGKSFSQSTGLQRHIIIHSGEKPHKCEVCERSFKQLGHLRRHAKIHSGEKPCIYKNKKRTMCGGDEVLPGFVSKNTSRQHKRHIDDAIAAPSDKEPSCSYARALCELCGKIFTSVQDARVHMALHTGEELHICRTPFFGASNLVDPLKTRSGKKPHMCNECEKSFSQVSDLCRHLGIHIGETPYVCKQCGKSFSYPSNFRAHHRIHTGEKPHVCNECGKSFAHIGNLRRHLRIHSGERPYVCKKCGKTFSDPGNLLRHHRFHTGEKPYVCKECGKFFSQSRSLRFHLRIHDRKKP